jgi:peptidoglycan/xylan/chitin deacetylase (PgdA/CDA1 family)
MAVVQTFEEKNASLTIGIIGNFFGDDPTLLSFLLEKVNGPGFSMEVANHGWNHEDFTNFDRDEQTDLLSKSNDRILGKLGVSPKVFIAPFNHINNNTFLAMAANDMYVASADATTNQVPLVKNMTSDDGRIFAIYHFPSTAQTGDLNADNTEWLGFTHEQTLAQIKDSMAKYGYAIVTMHPQEFSVREGIEYQNEVDMKQLEEVKQLLDATKAEGYTIVTVSDLANRVTVPEFSSSIVLMTAVIVVAYVVTVRMLSPSQRV